MKNTVLLSLFLALSISCKGQKSKEKNGNENVLETKNISFLDSLKSVCKSNTIEEFDIEKLKTDDFSNMLPINQKLFQKLYPSRNDFSKNAFFIYSCLPSNNDYLTLITYQKNQESENHSVDYMDLINIDSNGNQLDKIRLTAKDNEVLTYEVISILKDNLIKTTEKISSEYYSNMDTLYTKEYSLRLNGKKRIDTIEVKKSFEIRQY